MFQDKIVSIERLLEDLVPIRTRGQKIILTNGCFDVLHVGHVRYLQGAKNIGGFLVVAINSDASVKLLKGPGRPILPAAHRAQLVAALECVDRVVIFEEPDVVRIIETLKPDIHAKGTDYTADTVPEREVMRRLGGEVRIVGDPKDHSTRDLIQQVRSKFKIE
jgi:D-glycero-beta-D-manno-heptose 1-phosphate adenylyltransferase